MTTSQNGWPVVTSAQCDRGAYLGVPFPNGILAGPVSAIALWQLRRYAATVEQIKHGQCWGYDDKKIEGGTSWSNHASGTAWDINAQEHPMGASTASSFTPAQIDRCVAIVKASRGVLRWGGTYTGRKDSMHWEINANRAETLAFAAWIAGPHADLAIGDVGTNVANMQRACNKVPGTGTPIATDGIFGHLTEAKLLRVQSHFGITPDGICGPVTRGKLGLA